MCQILKVSYYLARSAKLPTGLYILLVLISSFFSFFLLGAKDPSPLIDNICLSGGKRGDYHAEDSVLYCIRQLCTIISTLRWAVLTVLSIGFCHTGCIPLCLDLVVFICVYFVFFSYCIYVGLLSAQWSGPSGIEAWSLGLLFLQCFDTVCWVFWPIKPVPDMTYNVFGGTLNLAVTALEHLLSLGDKTFSN